MQFLNLKKDYDDLRDEINQSVRRVFDSGQFIGGREVEEFEKSIAELYGVKHAISLNSGTDALLLSLEAIGIKGKEVITTPFTFFATAEAVIRAGGKPVFVDIKEDDFNINADAIEERITPKTKVILPVHLFGRPCAMEKIMELAEKYKLYVVEDAAQAFGVERETDSFNHAICFSFYPTKNLGACGDGGMVITNDDSLSYKISLLKNHGSPDGSRYDNIVIGINSRLDAIQAAILRIKLKHIGEYIENRRRNARYYSEKLSKKYFADSTYNQYTMRVESRDKMEVDFPYQIYYPKPLHLMDALSFLGYKKGDFPIAEKASKEVVSLPLLVTRGNQDSIIKQIKKYV